MIDVLAKEVGGQGLATDVLDSSIFTAFLSRVEGYRFYICKKGTWPQGNIQVNCKPRCDIEH